MTTQSFRERCIEKMFTAYVCDEDGGPYSGVAAAFDAVWNDIVEECALVAEGTMCCVDETEDYYSGFCDGVTDATFEVRKLKND
jgi:hypothetical protein